MSRTTIAAAILAETAEQYKQQIEMVTPFAERLHIDFSDGEMTQSLTVNTSELWWPQDKIADIHAMVMRPSEHVQALIALKPHMIIFHAEISEDLLKAIQYVKQNGIKAGVALQRQTVPVTLRDVIEIADHVMIFSGDLGHYGGTASLMQLEKVRLIRGISPSVEIGWDGGASVDNAFSLSQGGIDVINVGGAIQQSNDPEATYKALVGEINKQSVI